MSYIQKSLSDGENIHKVFEHHWFVKGIVGLHFLLTVLTFGLWLPVAVYVMLKWNATEQAVTNKRVVVKKGIMSTKTDEMRLNAIEAIAISQSVAGRIFGYGVVTITGRGAGDVTLRWVKDPMTVKREIENAENDQKTSSAV